MPPKSKEPRSEISDLLKKFAKDGTGVGSLDEITEEVKGLPTGNLAIDAITGVGGLPVGRVIESFGPPSSGKTTLALHTAAQLQKKIIAEETGDYILYIDFEHALDKKYCKSLGLDLEHQSVLVTQPDSLEKGAAVARKLVETGKVRLLIWDSVAEAQPEAVLEAETGQSQVAIRAKIMSQFLQQINNSLFKNDCTAIFINHIQEKISISGPARGVVTKTTPGGDALKFYSSLRLEFTQISKQKGKRFNPLTNATDEFTVSADTKVTLVKNKVGDPMRNCIVRVRYGQGFDNFWSALQVLLGHGKVKKTGAWIYFNSSPELLLPELPGTAEKPGAFQGEDNLLRFADTHPVWRQMVIDAAVETVKNATPTEVEDSTEDDDIDYGEFVKF